MYKMIFREDYDLVFRQKKVRIADADISAVFPLFLTFFGDFVLKAETKSKKHRPFPKKKGFLT